LMCIYSTVRAKPEWKSRDEEGVPGGLFSCSFYIYIDSKSTRLSILTHTSQGLTNTEKHPGQILSNYLQGTRPQSLYATIDPLPVLPIHFLITQPKHKSRATQVPLMFPAPMKTDWKHAMLVKEKHMPARYATLAQFEHCTFLASLINAPQLPTDVLHSPQPNKSLDRTRPMYTNIHKERGIRLSSNDSNRYDRQETRQSTQHPANARKNLTRKRRNRQPSQSRPYTQSQRKSSRAGKRT
jgi:hypothetical protein